MRPAKPRKFIGRLAARLLMGETDDKGLGSIEGTVICIFATASADSRAMARLVGGE